MSRRPALTLPPRPYLPGQTERPDEAIFEPLKEGLAPGLSPEDLTRSAAFLGGREAFARGYFWEAHELWEAVWMVLPPASAERHLLQGLIQLANGGLKARMGRENAARRIAALADTALREAFLQGQEGLMGLGRAEVEEMRNQALRYAG
ncbi:MAG: DUF309 domain-containing protein [Roseovarius sp.]|uniref:DUF309 domain-containing protein n=1 Tax=Roseovarius sp. TaxID=1486281 RepID=UPI0032EAB6CC